MRRNITAVLLSIALSSGGLPTVHAQPPKPVNSTEIPVGEALPGAFFATPESAEGPFPAVILLGGSEGGDSTARVLSEDFLSRGYAVLGLPYIQWGDQSPNVEGLPNAFASIPVDSAETALDWLQARPEVRADNVGLYGLSKGAEFALLAGSLIDGFAAIAAIVPSDVVWEGWGPGVVSGQASSFSWRGDALPFVPKIGTGDEFANPSGPDGQVRMRVPHDKGRNAHPELAVAARIAVEDIDEPVLVAGGDADTVWNSGEMAQMISERRAEAGLETVALIFTDAGHYLTGDGSQAGDLANAEAQREIYAATWEFFGDHLND